MPDLALYVILALFDAWCDFTPSLVKPVSPRHSFPFMYHNVCTLRIASLFLLNKIKSQQHYFNNIISTASKTFCSLYIACAKAFTLSAQNFFSIKKKFELILIS